MISLILSFAFSLFAAWIVISPFYSKEPELNGLDSNKDSHESG